MPSFSKGPWMLQQAGNGVRYIYSSGRNQPICRPLKSERELPEEEYEANAALIEDAPTLHKTLAGLIKAIDGDSSFPLEFVLGKARALVDKHN